MKLRLIMLLMSVFALAPSVFAADEMDSMSLALKEPACDAETKYLQEVARLNRPTVAVGQSTARPVNL
jgi:hypothetical protein